VQPLRAVRRWLKQPAALKTAAQAVDREALRREVKRLELEAERQEQDLLHDALPLAAGRSDRAAARANLLACLGAPVPEMDLLLAVLE